MWTHVIVIKFKIENTQKCSGNPLHVSALAHASPTFPLLLTALEPLSQIQYLPYVYMYP